MDKLIYEKEVTVAVHDTGVAGELKPSAIMQYFQDVATEHANILGVGRADLTPRGMFWAVARLSAVISRQVEFGETLTVRTWPHKPELAMTDRDFGISDSRGKTVITGTSKWCVLDIVRRTPRKLKGLLPEDEACYISEKAIGEEAEIIPPLTDFDPIFTKSFSVRNSDLDTNFHMNNARYGDIIYNMTDPNIFLTQMISRFDVNFIHELRAGQTYEVKRSGGKDILLEVYRDGAVAARLSARLTDVRKA